MNETIPCTRCGGDAEFTNVFISRERRYNIYWCEAGHETMVDEKTGKVVTTDTRAIAPTVNG